jgi:lysine 6-dehydrogenase
MKQYAVMGAGLMGRVVAKHFLQTESDAAVTLLDRDERLLGQAVDFVADERLHPAQVDVEDTDRAAAVLQGHDAAVGALPHRCSLDGLEAALRAAVSVVDMVGSSPEQRQALDSRARDAGVLLIPGCGVAPGVSNILVARGVELLDETHEAVIYVGGIPKRKAPPLEYQTVYSLESVFNACVRPVTIWLDGRETTVEPLTGVEILEFPEPIGKLEAYYTDGLASLPLTIKDKISHALMEKTLRYPGFAERVRFLKECGLLDTRPVDVGSVSVDPRDLLIQVLTPILELGPEGDVLVMRVTVTGVRDGNGRLHTFDLIDYLDPVTAYSAMARTTGFPAACAARMIAAGRITQRGVRFPEQLFIGELGREFLSALADHGITITHHEQSKVGSPNAANRDVAPEQDYP